MAIVDMAYKAWQADFEAQQPHLFTENNAIGPQTRTVAERRDLMRIAYLAGKSSLAATGKQQVGESATSSALLGEEERPRSPIQMADALERIAGGALADYEGCEADELHILRCAKLIRALAARQPVGAPEGYILIQAGDARRLCKYSTHSPSSALSARRVEAILEKIDGRDAGTEVE